MKQAIKLTENEIKNMIKETVQQMLKEELSPLKPGSGFKIMNGDIQKTIQFIAKQYNVNPKYLKQNGPNIVYVPPKGKGKPKIANTHNLPPLEFLRKEVAPQSDKIQQALQGSENEEWKYVPNAGRFLGGKLDPSNAYMVSNMGHVIVVNQEDGLKSRFIGYNAPTRGQAQVHIDNHAEGQHTTAAIHNLVAVAFLNADLNKYKVVWKNGDRFDNRVENLELVPRSKKSSQMESKTKPTLRLTENQLKQIIEETFQKVTKNKIKIF